MDEKSKYKQQLTCIRILEDDSYNVSVRKHRKPCSRPHAERVGGWAPLGADWARLPKCISCQDKDPEHCHFIGVYQSLSILEMQVSSLFSGCRMLESLGSGPTFSFPPAEIPCYPNLFNVPMSPKIITDQQVRGFVRQWYSFFLLLLCRDAASNCCFRCLKERGLISNEPRSYFAAANCRNTSYVVSVHII